MYKCIYLQNKSLNNSQKNKMKTKNRQLEGSSWYG